jgi:hypothetical protein
MEFKISEDYLNFFKNDKIVFDKLTLLKDRVYSDIPVFEEEINTLFSGNTETIITKIIDNIIIADDNDTRNEEEVSNGTIYPYDPTKADIDIREDAQTVFELVMRKWDQGKLILDPNFQRNFVWKPLQQSQFIESVILNFPLPAFYINKDKKGKYIVVDGRQRITTLRSFLKDEFKLAGLRALPQLNDKNFSELKKLDSSYQTRIEDKKLNVYLIQPTVPMEMVYDIFNRINTGGTQLQRQEIRNCIYMGKATKLLHKLAASDYFKEAIDNGVSPLRKKDEEAVLRCLSFIVLNYEKEYKGSISEFVEKALEKINKDLSDQEISNLETEFKRVMLITLDFFGSSNFRLPTENTRGRVNLALLEAVFHYFYNKSNEYLKKRKTEILKTYKNTLLKDELFIDSIKYSTNDIQRVKNRFTITKILLD